MLFPPMLHRAKAQRPNLLIACQRLAGLEMSSSTDEGPPAADRAAPYLFRDTIKRLINGETMPYEKLTA